MRLLFARDDFALALLVQSVQDPVLDGLVVERGLRDLRVVRLAALLLFLGLATFLFFLFLQHFRDSHVLNAALLVVKLVQDARGGQHEEASDVLVKFVVLRQHLDLARVLALMIEPFQELVLIIEREHVLEHDHGGRRLLRVDVVDVLGVVVVLTRRVLGEEGPVDHERKRDRVRAFLAENAEVLALVRVLVVMAVLPTRAHLGSNGSGGVWRRAGKVLVAKRVSASISFCECRSAGGVLCKCPWL